jgi:hypothetical protein
MPQHTKIQTGSLLAQTPVEFPTGVIRCVADGVPPSRVDHLIDLYSQLPLALLGPPQALP